MTTLAMNAATIDAALDQMVEQIVAIKGDGPWAVVGIRRGGDHLARRVAKRLEAHANGGGTAIPIGVVDITLYRDDGFGPREWPEVGVTDIPFRLREHTVVLVDDVLYTGRTVRAALDAILDYGRPKAVRLAVLVDRGLRELPIAADAVGERLATRPDDHVDVRLTEGGAESDAVAVEPAQTTKEEGEQP